MNRLARTRSQHYVSSPRRIASPFRSKHGPSRLQNHITKRRKVGGSGLAVSSKTIDLTQDSPEGTDDEDEENLPEDEDEDEEIAESSGSSSRQPLSSHGGDQRVNKLKNGKKGKGKAVEVDDVFGNGSEDVSPRKRKRGENGFVRGHSRSQSSGSAGSGSWIEMDEDEDEPKFIAESDQHLLAEAPAYALHRLRKAELIRLWKVAGMWNEDDAITTSSTGDDEEGGQVGKKELVDGLLAARKPISFRLISPLPSPRNSPRRKAGLESAIELRSLRSATSLLAIDTPSPSSSDIDGRPSRFDTDATPRAVPRTRSKVRMKTSPVRSVRRIRNHGRNGKDRKQVMVNGERKARFGDDVKSPANGLINRRERRSSTASSAYTTTDTSPPDYSIRNARRRQSITKSQTRASGGSSRRSKAPSDEDITDEERDATDEEDADPTPLVARLRSRTRSYQEPPASEADADDEEEEEEEAYADGSPGPSSRTRSRDTGDLRRRITRETPLQDSDEEEMEVESDNEAETVESPDEMEAEDGSPRPGPLTRSQLRASQDHSPPKHSRHASRHSLHSITMRSPSATPSALTPAPDSSTEESTDAAEDSPVEDRMTRSGKAFGVWQSRRRRLRQEAIDDPDMEADEDEEDDEEDEEEGPDIDLDEATAASLTRLLRDELVQLCEARGLEVGGTKPQLARALIDWRDEQNAEHGSPTASTASQSTAKPASENISSRGSKRSRKSKTETAHPKLVHGLHGIGSHRHVEGKDTPVLLRDHIHQEDPATPTPNSSKEEKETDLNLDLAELGLEDSIVKPEHLVKLERIGSGGFKDVFVGKYKGRKVAISEFREHLSEMDIRELKLLAEFSHPNIVRFRGISIPDDGSSVQCMLVSELCENGDLFDYIRNVACPSLKRLLGLMLDIARGLEYLHTRNPAIIHRDCKSSNILINRAGQAKVGDFGLARVKTSTKSMIRSLVGTVNWQAPELWSPAPRYDYKVDVFSAAMVYWEMMSGWIGEKKYPWEGHNEHYIYDAVGQKQRRPSVNGLRKHWGAEPVNLMERMWHQDAAERPTMSDVVADLEALIAEA